MVSGGNYGASSAVPFGRPWESLVTFPLSGLFSSACGPTGREYKYLGVVDTGSTPICPLTPVVIIFGVVHPFVSSSVRKGYRSKWLRDCACSVLAFLLGFDLFVGVGLGYVSVRFV